MIDVRPLEVGEASDNMAVLINGLSRRLGQGSRTITTADLRRIIQQPLGKLFLAYLGGAIVGMVTAVVSYHPTHVTMSIRDFVMDDGYHNQELGRRLMERVIDWALDVGVDVLEVPTQNTVEALPVSQFCR